MQLLIIVTGVARTGRVITAAALIMSISCAALMRRWCEGRRETGARAGHLSSPRGAEGVGREVALHPECRTFYTEIYMFSFTNDIADIIDVRMVAVCHVAWAQSIMINMGAPGPESVSRRVGSPKPRPFKSSHDSRSTDAFSVVVPPTSLALTGCEQMSLSPNLIPWHR